jgi:type I restriction enzyme, S subunit
MSATKNRVFRLTQPAYVVNHLATLEPSPEVPPRFFRYWLESFNPSRLIKDPSYPSISQEEIEDVEIDLPPLTSQNTFAARLDRADHLRRMRRYPRHLLSAVVEDRRTQYSVH